MIKGRTQAFLEGIHDPFGASILEETLAWFSPPPHLRTLIYKVKGRLERQEMIARLKGGSWALTGMDVNGKRIRLLRRCAECTESSPAWQEAC